VGHQNFIRQWNQEFSSRRQHPVSRHIRAMIALILAAITYPRAFFVCRHRLGLEAAALRQQLVVLKRKQARPRLCSFDRFFWIALRRLWTGWAGALIIVKSETVVSWHRAGFRLFWRLRTRRLGRPKISEEIRQLIRRMKTDDPRWGAPRIHGELLQLGFHLSEPTVSRYLQGLKRRTDDQKAKRWLAFLHNHREVIAAFDFFTVPTLTFRVLYCFFVIEHHRRRILHLNTTAHPTSDWIVQQVREALPLPCPYRYILFDRDHKFGGAAREFLKASEIKTVRISVRSPWQKRSRGKMGGQLPP
jgi:putative transposase